VDRGETGRFARRTVELLLIEHVEAQNDQREEKEQENRKYEDEFGQRLARDTTNSMPKRARVIHQ
jgi:hypothetical protein